MKKTKSFHKKLERRKGTEREGLLIGHFGASAQVEDAEGKVIQCHIRKNSEPMITGDKVIWQPENNQGGVILDHLPRKSLFHQPRPNGKNKLLAANIDIIIIVTAPPPILSETLIDHYLVAAENLKIQPILLFNKMDLLTDNNRQSILDRLAIYEKIGYTVIFSSIYTPDGLHALKNCLHDKTGVLVGMSGVGKSTIIAHLAPNEKIKIGENATSGLGKHTTTMTRLYHLKENGNLIDSPGVREFHLWQMSREEILHGFSEFRNFAGKCKFRDCLHIKEPGCAIKIAVEKGEISPLRFASYEKLIIENNK